MLGLDSSKGPRVFEAQRGVLSDIQEITIFVFFEGNKREGLSGVARVTSLRGKKGVARGRKRQKEYGQEEGSQKGYEA